MFLFLIPVLFLFSLNLLIHPIPRLTTLPLVVTTFHNNSSNQTSSEGPLLHLIQQYRAKSEIALRPPRPLHRPYQFTPAHVPQKRYYQVRCKTFPRSLRCLAHWKEPRFKM
ncbi:hypothetical protein DFH94DRAFT_784314 [Russula ochroleuca]|uniref:Secreted protein n=1 Tax=Russula ochroleuca TaxID=152965 RepID=A0A9P5JV39_9AGAM|nr:hypothetical protein DFH94DRAFT_784314 [Russula ochroleuca]